MNPYPDLGTTMIQPSPPALVAGRSRSLVIRRHAYAFVTDEEGQPLELGSGRFAKTYLGEQQWLESKTGFRRPVAIKILQRGVGGEDALRFQLEKELLERVQGHPNIVTLHASGESEDVDFVPQAIRDKVENDFMILELCDMSLEERLKGSRNRELRENLLGYPMRERIFRVLEYLIPVASAIEYSHMVCNVVHRDIKPANVLLRLPDDRLRGSSLEVRLADFNVGKGRDEEIDLTMTRASSVPGTLFFQSPEQENGVFELLVNVTRGSTEVEFFEDFFMHIAKNDTFQLFNRPEQYPLAGADRKGKRVQLAKPFAEPSESNVRARIVKSVDRPADIYSLGAMLYYLVSGAFANPKAFYDAFHGFIEYQRDDAQNTVQSYLEHQYRIIASLQTPDRKQAERIDFAPDDRFFSFANYLDGNGELLDPKIVRIVGRAMIRNKPDSYCQAWDVDTDGISRVVQDLVQLYCEYGIDPVSRPMFLARFQSPQARGGFGRRLAGWLRPSRAKP